MRPRALCALFLAALSSACAELDTVPDTQSTHVENYYRGGTGTAAGAVTGAFVGSYVGHGSTTGAVTGAAIGSAVGHGADRRAARREAERVTRDTAASPAAPVHE